MPTSGLHTWWAILRYYNIYRTLNALLLHRDICWIAFQNWIVANAFWWEFSVHKLSAEIYKRPINYLRFYQMHSCNKVGTWFLVFFRPKLGKQIRIRYKWSGKLAWYLADSAQVPESKSKYTEATLSACQPANPAPIR